MLIARIYYHKFYTLFVTKRTQYQKEIKEKIQWDTKKKESRKNDPEFLCESRLKDLVQSAYTLTEGERKELYFS